MQKQLNLQDFKNYLPFSKLFYAFLAFLTMFSPTETLAQTTCDAQPSCSELNYSQNISADCPSENIIYCPFDTSYKKCLGKSCSNIGFTTADKSTWCKTLVVCPNDSTYTACAELLCGDFPYTACPVGASCSSCDVDGMKKYKVTGCADGYKSASDGLSCIEKTCSDYGYQKLKPSLTSSNVCKNRYSVRLGASNDYCYTNCATCTSLGYPASVNEFCKTHSKSCYTTSDVSVKNYSYGTCTSYTVTSLLPPCAASERQCSGIILQ